MILEPRGAGHRALEDHGRSRGSSCISVRLCPRAVGQPPTALSLTGSHGHSPSLALAQRTVHMSSCLFTR